ncbi:hypothetical protein BGZ99_001661 [Dissophora globulifera]|uniref:FAD-binding FR-type domain-containing protein n=1 Tax=Dissophora globulifera TaxID=979702 RepID=A0A9P6RNM0_9FUNG|nr:hypothetical protein BGZ99_001661 [Dissophora globulifera]
MKFQAIALSLLIVFTLYLVADFKVTWLSDSTIYDIYYYNKRDIYFILLFVVPAIGSHLVTIWGHYYRADALFQESISQVSTSSTRQQKKRISVWERHDPWWTGFTVKFWVLVIITAFLNLIWFVQPLIAYLPTGVKFLGTYGAVTAYLAFGTGYAAMGSCGILLLLVLRRSMLQAIGFTYSDLLPLHRWMGVAFIVWSTIHTICYVLYYVHFDAFWTNFNFDGNTRGPQNMIACFAYAALCGLGFTAIPQIRRSCYLLFITTHRIFTVITFVGTLMHFPYYMIWYYVLPSMCLYLADRFVPKFIQSCSVARKVQCSFNKEADILTIVISSRNRLEPLKPYYPGDYVNLEIPELSSIYHPFTIASYWAEDPYSMTLYIRSFQETKTSWTGALARLCESKGEEPLLLKANVDGVFGDRNHDYLSTRVMVIFSAGAAITTFMGLLKAMAAQIESSVLSSAETEVIRVHLICTFRYESELYAYGDFMHRIMHDPRFTSWLHTQVYISRPDKFTPPLDCPQCASEFVCGREVAEEQVRERVDESTSLLAAGSKGSRYGAASESCANCGEDKGCCMGSSSPRVQSSASSATVTTPISLAATCASTVPTVNGSSSAAALTAAITDSPYRYKSLPTFLDASSATIATVHAKKDLVATTLILLVPMLVFVWARAIPWEGTYNGESHWCRTAIVLDQHMTNRCLWSYSVLPGVIHIIAASLLGYLGLWVARNTNILQSRGAKSLRHVAGAGGAEEGSRREDVKDAYQKLVQGLVESDPKLVGPKIYKNGGGVHSHVDMKSTTKGSIKFRRGRLQVNHHIQELMASGIGRQDTNSGIDAKDKEGGVLVFGGGPDAFVDMIEESCKKARWGVDFHRETWSP